MPDHIKDIAINASDKIYEQDDLGPVQSIKNSISFILTQITQLAQFLQDNEYEVTTAYKKEEKVTKITKHLLTNVCNFFLNLLFRMYHQSILERRL